MQAALRLTSEVAAGQLGSGHSSGVRCEQRRPLWVPVYPLPSGQTGTWYSSERKRHKLVT